LSEDVLAGEIHEAVKRGEIEKVKSILSAEPYLLDAPDILGHTPLSLSAIYAQWSIFHFLLESGANINIVTKSKSTVLHCICQHNKPDMLELSLKNGASSCLSVRDVFGEYSPMLRAVQRDCKDIIAMLFEVGVSPDEVTKEGWNALHLAAKCGHRHLYGLLIEKGVSLDVKDNFGKKPMEYDFKRPEPISINKELYKEYIGRYTWEGAPEGLCIRIFIEGESLILDDYGLDKLYPIGEDEFYCSKNPWTLKFFRDHSGEVNCVELTFLRRSVIVNKVF
jgi:ankyrin repeat protein